jgi:hypothetical protein
MAILDAEWWNLWWPWLLLWGGTAVLTVFAVFLVVRALRRRRPVRPHTHGSVFYLDDNYVMDLYRMHGGKYKAALRQEVEERISDTRETELSADVPSARIGRKRGVNNEVFRRYVEHAEPITVLGIVIDVLERAHDIVQVDLRTGEITGDHALAAALDLADAPLPAGVALGTVDAFVSIRGHFTFTDKDAETTTLTAGHLRLTCSTGNLRGTTLPTGPFPARCLARPQEWHPDGHLVLHPIAIFR